MSAPRQPLQNILWLVGERLARAVLTATALGVVARHLEPAGFGHLNFALTVVAIAGTLANLGLESLVVNELIRRPDQPGAVLGTAFRLRLLAGAVTAATLVVLAWLLALPDRALIAIIALGLVLQPLDVIDLWFQRHLESRRAAIARFVGLSAGATLKLALAAGGAGLTAFAWAQLADVAFIALALGWAGWRSPRRSGPWTWDREIARTLWARGAALALSTLAVSLAMRVDQLLVWRWLGQKEAGIYFSSVRLTEFALILGGTVALSLFPGLSASHQQSPEKYHASLQTMFDALSAVGWAMAVGCSALGWWIIPLLYGPAYAEAIPVLALHGWAGLIALNASARWQFIVLSAPPALNLAAATLHGITVVALSAWWLPRFGTVGAAGALLTANLVSGVLTSALFPPLRPCAAIQVRGLLIPFTPGRWRALLDQFHRRAV